METVSALLAFCTGNSPVTGECPTQRPVTQSFGVFFDLRLNKRLGKQSCSWRYERPLCPLWRHCNVEAHLYHYVDGAADMHRPPYVNMVAADALAPNRRQTISSHHADSTMTIALHGLYYIAQMIIYSHYIYKQFSRELGRLVTRWFLWNWCIYLLTQFTYYPLSHKNHVNKPVGRRYPYGIPPVAWHQAACFLSACINNIRCTPLHMLIIPQK